MIHNKQSLWLNLIVVMASAPGVPDAEAVNTELIAPVGYYLPPAEAKKHSMVCAPPPTPHAGAMQFPSKYEGSDKARDQVNKDAAQRYKEMTADIVLLEKNSVKMAENYLSGKLGIASRNCLLEWLESWADNNTLLSIDSNHTGMAVRKWALASIASAYLLVKVSAGAPPIVETKREAIEDWLALLADQVVRDWSNRPERKRNNHDYWSAWAVMVASVVLDNEELFEWAYEGLQKGLAQIDSNGFLPNELKRNTKALGYHNYALQPLVMLAVFAETNNSTLTASERSALTRLVKVTVQGLQNPDLFQQKTGSKQDMSGLYTSYALAWMEPYASYFGHELLFTSYFETLRPMKSTRMGGNLTRLFKSKTCLAVKRRHVRPYP